LREEAQLHIRASFHGLRKKGGFVSGHRFSNAETRSFSMAPSGAEGGPSPFTIEPVAQKTNAARLLDQLGIRYELREYEVDPDNLAAETVAVKIGMPPEQVFKTLVARGDRNGICMAVIPGDQELDLKALASAAGERKIQLVPVKELQALTGYVRGGVTALAAKRDFPVYVDETIELFDVISISAGVRGLQILLAPADYLHATNGRVGALGQPKKS
jgi:Cys-tRNA(Pro)/Cys-tRNA(Cys) deacylase